MKHTKIKNRNFTKMNRRLIFTTNEGGTDEFLPGVAVDLQHYIEFFQSDEGGAWEKWEMCHLSNCKNKREFMISLCANISFCDYLLLVFIGHGGATRYGETQFKLSCGDSVTMSEIRNWAHSVRCLFIADSCRCVENERINENAQRDEERMFSVSENKEHRMKCRQIYNNCIKDLPKGSFTAGLAVSLGEEAKEDSNGGYYSQSLIKSANSVLNAVDAGHCEKFYSIHAMAKLNIQQLFGDIQHPDYIGSCMYHIPPFVVK